MKKLYLIIISILFSAVTLAAPIHIVFQKQKDPVKLEQQVSELTKELKTFLNTEVKTSIPVSYSATVQSLISKQADIAFLDSFSYYLAAKETKLEILLVEARLDSENNLKTSYDSLFLIKKDSKIKNFSDLKKQSKKLKIAFTNPASTSGYLFPYKELVKAEIIKPKQDPSKVFKKVYFAGSYAQALDMLVKNQVDICAVSHYAFEGESSLKYISKKDKEDIKILKRNLGVPTHILAVRAELDPKLKQKIKEFFLNESTSNQSLLKDIYGTAKFSEETKNHLEPLSKAFKVLNIKHNLTSIKK